MICFAEAIEEMPSSGIVKCPRIKNHIQLTGELLYLNWSNGSKIEIYESKVPSWQPFNTHLNFGKLPRDNSDLSATCWICRDEVFLYLGIDVNDDIVVLSGDEFEGYFHNQDSVILYFQLENNDPIALRLLPKSNIEEGAVCIQQELTSRAIQIQSIEAVRVKATIKSEPLHGYIIEAAIPFSFLGLNPEPGIKIGFDIEIEDCDCKEEGVTKALIWAGGQRQKEIYGKLEF